MILFDLNHAISKSSPGKTKQFENKHTKDLEEWILEYTNQLPPAEDYIIPVSEKDSLCHSVSRWIMKLINIYVRFVMIENSLRYLD